MGGSANVFNMIQDPVESPADDIFDGGQTKDTSDIDAWSWKGAEPNDKNDIQHAFAAAYEDPDNGHLIVYFGLDRLDSSGNAAAGFWFLKRPVEQVTIDGENIFVYKGTTTPAEHSVGDVLVQSDFTNGGIVERIDSYGWGVAPAGSVVSPGSPLRLIAEGADCDTAAEPPELCGQVNDGGEDVPANWPGSVNPAGSVKFKGPGGVVDSTTFNDATFLEGGIDLTSLFGRNTCTAQFIAETRQSQSETAVLEDKVEGDFELCDIEVTKDGPEKSKVGDDATYTVEVKNTGAVTLFKQSIEDTLAGDLTDGTNPDIVSSDCNESLAPDETCTIEYTYTVQAGDPDPLENTVDVEYNRDEDLTGDSVTDSASHEVNLFQPGIKVTKTGDAFSKTGDTVTYNFEIENTSSSDSPDLVLDTIDDNVLGDLAGDAPADCSELAAEDDPTTEDVEDKCNFSVQHQVSATEGAGETLTNTVTAHYHPEGFLNDITDSDDHTVDIVHPALELTKTGDAFSKTGDTVTYTVTVKNTGDTGLELDTITDSIDGDLADDAPAACDALAANDGQPDGADECSFTFTHVVSATEGAGETLTNTVTAHYDLPDSFGLANDITDSDDHTVDIVHPALELTKTGDAFSKTGDTVTYTVTVKNTGDTGLELDTITDSIDGDLADDAPAACDALAANDGQPDGADELPFTFTHVVSATEGAGETLTNTVTAHYDLPDSFGLANDITDSDDHTVDIVHPALELTKTGDAFSKTGDTVTYTVTVKNTGDTGLELDTITDSIDGDLADDAPAACDTLAANDGQPDGADECSFTFTHVVSATEGAGETLTNTVTAHYDLPDSFGLANDITDSDDHTVDIVHPALELTKTGDAFSKTGDTVTYTVTVKNTGDTGLELDTITDSIDGDLADDAPAACDRSPPTTASPTARTSARSPSRTW